MENTLNVYTSPSASKPIDVKVNFSQTPGDIIPLLGIQPANSTTNSFLLMISKQDSQDFLILPENEQFNRISIQEDDKIIAIQKERVVIVHLPDQSSEKYRISLSEPIEQILEKLCYHFSIWPQNIWGIFRKIYCGFMLFNPERPIGEQYPQVSEIYLRQIVFPPRLSEVIATPLPLYIAQYRSMINNGEFMIDDSDEATLKRFNWFRKERNVLSFPGSTQAQVEEFKIISSLHGFGCSVYNVKVHFSDAKKGVTIDSPRILAIYHSSLALYLPFSYRIEYIRPFSTIFSVDYSGPYVKIVFNRSGDNIWSILSGKCIEIVSIIKLLMKKCIIYERPKEKLGDFWVRYSVNPQLDPMKMPELLSKDDYYSQLLYNLSDEYTKLSKSIEKGITDIDSTRSRYSIKSIISDIEEIVKKDDSIPTELISNLKELSKQIELLTTPTRPLDITKVIEAGKTSLNKMLLFISKTAPCADAISSPFSINSSECNEEVKDTFAGSAIEYIEKGGEEGATKSLISNMVNLSHNSPSRMPMGFEYLMDMASNNKPQSTIQRKKSLECIDMVTSNPKIITKKCEAIKTLMTEEQKLEKQKSEILQKERDLERREKEITEKEKNIDTKLPDALDKNAYSLKTENSIPCPIFDSLSSLPRISPIVPNPPSIMYPTAQMGPQCQFCQCPPTYYYQYSQPFVNSPIQTPQTYINTPPQTYINTPPQTPPTSPSPNSNNISIVISGNGDRTAKRKDSSDQDEINVPNNHVKPKKAIRSKFVDYEGLELPDLLSTIETSLDNYDRQARENMDVQAAKGELELEASALETRKNRDNLKEDYEPLIDDLNDIINTKNPKKALSILPEAQDKIKSLIITLDSKDNNSDKNEATYKIPGIDRPINIAQQSTITRGSDENTDLEANLAKMTATFSLAKTALCNTIEGR